MLDYLYGLEKRTISQLWWNKISNLFRCWHLMSQVFCLDSLPWFLSLSLRPALILLLHLLHPLIRIKNILILFTGF
jgi:hypothetical protein